MTDSTMILALFPGIGDLFLALTLEKPKENLFLASNLKKHVENQCFCSPEHMVTLGGTAHRQNLYTQTPVTSHFYDLEDTPRHARSGHKSKK